MAPAALFAVVADSDRLYRALGQVEVLREPLSGEGASRFLLRAIGKGRSIPFAELPPQWNQSSLLVTKRVLHQGILTSLATRLTFTPQLQGTQLLVELQVEPRLPQLAWLVKLYAQGSLWHLVKTLRLIDAGVSRGQKPLLKPARLSEEPLAGAVRKTKTRVLPEEQPVIDALVEHLKQCDDLEVDSLRLEALSEQLGQPAKTLLGVLLWASSEGLLQFGLSVLCPSCRNPAARFDHLFDLPDEAFCNLCELRIPVDFANNVEVSFRPAEPLRKVPRPLYASVNPAAMPHVVTQLVLPGMTKLTIPVPHEPGEFRLWARGGAHATLQVNTLGPQMATITVGDAMVPLSVEVALGGTLEIDHQTAQARHFKIERPEWKATRLTAHDLTLHPLFRRLFPGELPNVAVQFPVPTVALLKLRFPMVGELCAALGDGSAFRLIADCLEAVCRAIEAGGGAVLRLCTDGVSAAFAGDGAALTATWAAKKAVRKLRADNPFAHLLVLKAGVFVGPASVVRVDGRLDYFGQTEAICDRMLAEAHPSDILVSASCLAHTEQHPDLRAGPIFSLAGKGLPTAISVVRLTLEP